MQNTFNAFWAGGEEILPAEGRTSICAQVKTNWRKWIPPFYALSALRSLAAYSSTPHREHSLLALALLLIEWASAVQKKRQERGSEWITALHMEMQDETFMLYKGKIVP